jgi:hypothetical protein
MLNFPDTPAEGDTFEAPNGVAWLFQQGLWVIDPGPKVPLGLPFCIFSTNNLALPKASAINSGSVYPFGSTWMTNDPSTFEKITVPDTRIRLKRAGMYLYEMQVTWNSPSATAVPMEWTKGILTTIKHVPPDAAIVTTAGAAFTMPPISAQVDEGAADAWSTTNWTGPRDHFIVGADSSAGATIWTCSCRVKMTRLMD